MTAQFSSKRPAGDGHIHLDKSKHDVQDKKMVRLSVDIDEALYKKVKSRSIQQRRKTVELVREAITDYLDSTDYEDWA